MAQLHLIVLILSTIGLLLDVVNSSKCSTSTVGCSSGCWFDGYKCVPVGPGYFSPRDDDEKFPCEKGTFSDENNADICSLCPPGSFNGLRGQSYCMLCPTGFFQDQHGKHFCSSCTPGYGGQGSNSFYLDAYTKRRICLLEETGIPTLKPSSNPSIILSTMSPTTSPTSLPSKTYTEAPILTEEPSSQPSKLISGSPTIQQPSSGPSTQTHQHEQLDIVIPIYDDDYSFPGKESDTASSRRETFGILLVIMATLSIFGMFVIYSVCQPGEAIAEESSNAGIMRGDDSDHKHLIWKTESQGHEKDLGAEIHYVDAIIEPEENKSKVTNDDDKATLWAEVVQNMVDTKSQGHAQVDCSEITGTTNTRQV